jgi:hypothetical protein
VSRHAAQRIEPAVMLGKESADPRNGLRKRLQSLRRNAGELHSKRKPTAVQSGNRQAALLGERQSDSADNRLYG